MSDHRLIRFDIEAEQETVGMHRQPKATNREQYDQLLAEGLSGTIRGVNYVDYIELAEKALHSAIMQAYQGACPEKPRSVKLL